jgi:hypothetical protein
MFDVIERLKSEWTDKYVVVDSPAPELARFARSTGQVKTVNMNGRCLVEFDQYNNIAWYDIDPAFLKIVPKPLPKPAEEKAKPSKPAAKAAPAAETAKPAAKKSSTADILAAARGKAAAAKPAGEAKPAAGGKPSTADILARARGAKAAAPAAAEPPAAEPAAEVAEEPAPAPKASPKKPAGGALPSTTADKIAWCRAHDAKG